jgi:mannosyl-oligosaccharide alpha-1,2-mannosidase
VACFAGGNFLLGGKVLKEQKYVDFGLVRPSFLGFRAFLLTQLQQLTHSCHNTYRSTETGIGPEFFSWIPSECLSNEPRIGRDPLRTRQVSKYASHYRTNSVETRKLTSLNSSTIPSSPLPPVTHVQFNCNSSSFSHASTNAFYSNTGFLIQDASYNLRPEVLESYYYAYRITGDRKYQDWAWDAFNAITTYARLQNGFNFLGNVNVAGGENRRGNGQESYFFAETLKYAYLIFGEEGVWQVNPKGQGVHGSEMFVFNTEGHPLRVA